MVTRSLTAVGSVGALLLLLTACAPEPVPAPSSPSAAAPTPTVTETVAAPVLTPTVPFDGDCARTIAATDLDEILGAGWMPREQQLRAWDPARVIPPALDATGTVGGLDCRWFAGEGGLDASVDALGVVVLPAASAPPTFTADFSAARCDPSYDASFCRVVTVDDDLWVMVSAGSALEQPPTGVLSRAAEAVRAAASEGFDGQAADPQPEWWSLFECDALAEEMTLAEVIGEDFDSGYWEGSEQPEQTMLDEAGVERTCNWSTSAGNMAPDGGYYTVALTMAPGAGWNWDAIAGADDADVIEVDGAEAAVAFAFNPPDAEAVYASDGVNVLKVVGAPRDIVADLASRALAVLAG